MDYLNDESNYLNDEKKRLVIEAESIIEDKTLWKDILVMKESFQNSNDKFHVDGLLKLLHSERHKQLILAYTCLNLAKERKYGEDNTYHV